jgi:hypothetical protein
MSEENCTFCTMLQAFSTPMSLILETGNISNFPGFISLRGTFLGYHFLLWHVVLQLFGHACANFRNRKESKIFSGLSFEEKHFWILPFFLLRTISEKRAVLYVLDIPVTNFLNEESRIFRVFSLRKNISCLYHIGLFLRRFREKQGGRVVEDW